jgi:hypothetical protein
VSAGHQFTELRAVALLDAREEVVGFAVDLHQQDLRAWERGVEIARNAGKPAPQKSRLAFDLAHARTESRRIRLKRERDATYFNELVNPTPQY